MRYTLLVLATSAPLCALMARSAPAAAQVLRGTVIDDATEAPIGFAQVALLVYGTNRVLVETESDTLGHFRMDVRGAGTFSIQVARIGYEPLRIDSLEIGDNREVVVELRMGQTAVPVEPIRVLGNNRFDYSRVQEYYERLENMSRVGIGRFVTREEIEAHPVAYATDLFHAIPTVSIQGGQQRVIMMRNAGGDCIPQVYVDGVRMNRDNTASLDDYITGDSVEGIEIYRGFAETPAEYFDPTGCGVILVWSRRAYGEGRPLTWQRVLIGASIVGIVLFLVNR